MSTGNKKVVKKGFGITKETRGSSSLKFRLNPENGQGGLELGCIKEMNIGTAEFGDSQKGNFSDFAGKTVPTLNIVIEGIPAAGSKAAPVHIHSYKPMPLIAGDDSYDWFYDAMFQTLKHIIDVMSNDVFLDEYADLLTLAIDFEEGMEFDDLMKAYKTFFEGVITVLKGDGKKLPSLIVDEKSNPVLIWIKLLLYYNSKPVNNGNPGFSNYPGDGIIEKYVDGVAPNLRIMIEKGDSIIPKAKGSGVAAPAATANGAPSAAPSAGAPAGGTVLPPFMTK